MDRQVKTVWNGEALILQGKLTTADNETSWISVQISKHCLCIRHLGTLDNKYGRYLLWKGINLSGEWGTKNLYFVWLDCFFVGKKGTKYCDTLISWDSCMCWLSGKEVTLYEWHYWEILFLLKHFKFPGKTETALVLNMTLEMQWCLRATYTTQYWTSNKLAWLERKDFGAIYQPWSLSLHMICKCMKACLSLELVVTLSIKILAQIWVDVFWKRGDCSDSGYEWRKHIMNLK